MKSIVLILLGLLLTIAFVAAQEEDRGRPPYQCPKNCGGGHTCHIKNNDCHCRKFGDINDIKLEYCRLNSWVDGACGKTYTQWDIKIVNCGDCDLHEIYIGYDYTLRLRDSSSIWNIARLPYGVLTLPSYQTSINAGASYTFGFIIEGTQKPNLDILYVRF
ncbi:cellulose-binding domain-containing protein [Dictyostelium discoideum AX4]|uniref:Cellulose-binding domain-containing protein n=1 Tax=Dictyostelium discoideum TaxID=44689 RepID=Q86K68_DICDI|nr:cellulose-binding domain-containing protein [Dictyostelium discoideum AX4]EAL68781.1 cellulose-binding domain-containing protein [Dictyostelium discoideum AX4]|eukprot:XP_642718.1 cellulose-binding domain-containing protein [Dictyostelium discoideum AX4]